MYVDYRLISGICSWSGTLRGRLFFVIALLLVGSSAPVQGQIEELPRPPEADTASFGVSVALGDSLAAVGASGESVCGSNAGAVYIFRRMGGPQFASWRFEARLTPDPCRSNAFFGDHVALHEGRLLVSASSEHFADEGSNAVFVFERARGGRWRQTARLTRDQPRRDGLFASDIDLDHHRAVVSTSGIPEEGIGGAVYVYEYRPTTGKWQQTARVTASGSADQGVLGGRVALDGNYLAIGASTYFAREPGIVYVFRRDAQTSQWRQDTVIRGVEAFFIDLDLSGSTLIVGESRAGDVRSGRAVIYRKNGIWREQSVLRPSTPYESGLFGSAVSVEGSWALVTGYDEQLGMEINIDRVAYVYRRVDTNWVYHTVLDVGQVDFGAAFDQHDSTVLISSVPARRAGTVYVIQLR